MIDAPILVILGGIGGVILTLLILHTLIRSAVAAALRRSEYFQDRQSRILVMLLKKQGLSRDEIIKLIESKDDDFWDLIER